MKFANMEEFYFWINKNKVNNFAGGSQGECFKIGNKVFKIFSQYIENDFDVELYTYEIDEIMQFKSINNDTYVWPLEPIMVGNEFVGYITDYIDAKSLFQINPLEICLDKFESDLSKAEKDIKTISEDGVLTFDVSYNILYGRDGFKIIDTLDYVRRDVNRTKLYYQNLKNFYYEIRLFLIDGYFDDFVDSDTYIFDLCYNSDESFILFLKEFRKKLSEIEGYEIKKLGEAKKSLCLRKSIELEYIRDLSK